MFKVNESNFRQFAQRINDGVWAMREEAMERLLGRMRAGIVIDEPQPLSEYEVEPEHANLASKLDVPRSTGSVMVLPIYGVIEQHRSWWADVFVDEIAGVLDRLVADESVGAIVLQWDSPGGSVFGVPELAERVRELRAMKPIYSIADAEMYSAAYWIGSAATKVFVTPSGGVGSIGVWNMHVDASKAFEDAGYKISLVRAGKYKVEANPWEPLSEDAREAMQGRVDAYYDMFLEAVAKNRGIRPATVKSTYGEGRTVLAEPALAAGMVDGIATLSDLLGAIVPRKRGSNRATAEASILLAEQGIYVPTAVVPSNPSGGDGEGVEGTWTAPGLGDFTDEQWEDLSDSDRRRIAGYYGWYDTLDSFGNLKLPHHFPPNHGSNPKASLAGCRNALARLSQTQGVPASERDAVQSHLRAHLPSEE